jgi:hypothetical protein
MDAIAALNGLSDRRFDVIYLDAAKSPHNAFAQSALAWPLLKVGGVIIWDDLLWEGPSEWEPAIRSGEGPGRGILLFCSTFKPCLKVLHKGYQLIARKTDEWPPLELALLS